MKKLFILLTMLIVGIGSSWATEYTYNVTLGSMVTDLSTLSSSKYYVLKNVGSGRFNYYTGTQLDARVYFGKSCLVKLNYDGTNVTIQDVTSGKYYQGLKVGNRVSLGTSPVNFTFNIDGVNTGQFRFANNDCFMNRTSAGTQYPIGAATSGTADFSRWNIYEVSVTETEFEGTITYSTATGEFTSTNSDGTWGAVWESYGLGLKLSVGANNIKITDGSIWSGASGCTYTLTAPDGYLITGYTISGNAQTSAQNLQPITPTPGSATTFATSGTTTLTVSGIATGKATFSQSTPNKGITISSFTVSLIPINSVTSIGELSNSKCYNIINNRGWWAVASGGSEINSTYELELAPSSSDTKQQFAIISYEHNKTTQYYLYSVNEGKYAYINGTKLSLSSTVTPAVILNSPVTFSASTYSQHTTFPVVIGVGGKMFGISTGHNPDVYNHEDSADEGNASAICEADDFDATGIIDAIDEYYSTTVQYIIKDTEGNTLFTSGEYSATIGDEITDADFPSECQRPFCSYDVEETTVVAGLNTVNVTATFNMPFTASTDYATAKWYFMTMRTSKYAIYGESAPYALNTKQDLTANGMWAFIGNPYTGIKVINKAAGNGKYLEATATQPSMTTTQTSWTIGNCNGNFTLYESSVGYIHDISNDGKMKYWEDSGAATDDGSVFRVEEAEPTIVISKTTGTYYLSNGTAISNPDEEDENYWGPTWKSTRTVGGNILLTLTTTSGMDSKSADIYTGDNGAAMRYTLTAATGYVITGYSVAGTANSTDITITPRVRKNLTITNGQSGNLSVTDLDLKTTSFTLSGANSKQGNLSSVTLSVTLKPTATINYTAPITTNTTATIGYKHTAIQGRKMMYMTSSAGGVTTSDWATTALLPAPSTVAAFTFEYVSDLRAYYIKETSSNKYVYAKDDLTWAEGSRNTFTNVAALGVNDLPDDDEGKTLFLWEINDGGDNAGQSSFYIRPKSNTNTAISVQSDNQEILGFYDLSTKDYAFAHASLLTWEQQVGLYYTSDRSNNVMKAGKIGYPKTTSTEYTTLLGLLSTFTGGHTYTKSDYTNLLSYYDNYIAATDIVTPPANTFLRINSVLGANASLQAANESTRMKFSTTKDVETIFLYDGSHLISYSKGLTVNNVREMGSVGTVGNGFTFVKALNGNFGQFSVKCTDGGSYNNNYLYSTGENNSNADRNTYSDGWRSNNSFTLEPVTSLPVTFKKKGLGYTTFFTPVALQIPAKTHAYVCQRNNETLTFYEITKITTKDGDNDVATIPANTAVLLYNEDAGTEGAPDLTTVSFKVTSCKDEGGNDIQINNNSLDGTLAAETMTTFRVVDEKNYDIYSLRTSNSGAKVGFFKKTEGDCAGFKSWLRVEPTTGDARNFTIYFDGEEAPTGIVEALGLENDNVEIYDLNGRKLSTYKKGINIVNGKKVMVQ